MPHLRTALLGVAILLSAALPRSLHAQKCDQGRVSRVVVDNQSIFPDDQADDENLGWAFRLANKLHLRTRPQFIRRELLLSVGDCYDAFRVADSERILRAYDFIAQAEVFGLRLPDGSWEVRVRTQDEWSTRIEVAGELDEGLELRSVSIGEENLLGRGMRVGAGLSQRDAQRDMGVSFFTPRLLNSRTDFRVELGTTRAGRFIEQELVHPFLGEVGRFGLRQRFSRNEDFFQYSVGPDDQSRFLLAPFSSEFIETAIAYRWGEPGDLLVGGLAVSRESLDFADFDTGSEFIDDGRSFDEGVPAPDSLLDIVRPQTRFQSGTRVSLLFAHRQIRFTQRIGLDALRGIEDLQLGTDISLTLGRTFGADARGGVPDDVYTRVRLYAASAPDPFTLVFDAAFEGRQIFAGPGIDNDGWRDTFAEVDLLAYWQPIRFDRHTLMARASAAGAWAVDLPYQLTLGGATGVRGYNRQDLPGARRVKLTVEDRIYLGWPSPQVFDFGLTVFGDVGRIWAGDVPFGVDSGWLGTVGGGLRIGFPTESRGVVRLDVAFPVTSDGFGGPIFRVSAADLLGLRGGDRDPQIARSRPLLVGPDRFNPLR